MKMENIVGFVFLFAGLLCVMIPFVVLLNHIAFFQKAVVVPGTIVRYDQRESDNGQIMYAAVVVFSFNGQIRETRGSFSDSANLGDIGQTISVGINPNYAEQIRIKSMKEMWPLIVFPLFFGLIALGAFLFIAKICALPFPGEKFFEDMSTFVNAYPVIFRIIKVGLISFFPLLLSGGGGWMLYNHITFFKNAIRVPGTIVRYHSYKSENDDSRTTTTMYRAVVSYSFDGITREITSSIASNSYNKDTIGQTCEVGINPKNPYDARIYSKTTVLIAIALLCFGGILLRVFWGIFQ